jgi:hypothetical protein
MQELDRLHVKQAAAGVRLAVLVHWFEQEQLEDYLMDIGALLNSVWSKYSKNLAMCIVIYLVGMILGGMLAIFVVGIPIMAGVFKALRKAQRGEAPDFNDLFSEMSNIGKWAPVWVIFVGLCIVSCIPVLGQIAGIICGFGLVFLFPLMLERDMAAFDAAKQSFSIVKENLGTVVLPVLVLGLIVAVSGVIVIGPILTAPMMLIGIWEIFDHITSKAQA